MKFKDYLTEAEKAQYECMEWGKKFKRSGDPKKEIRCPSCKSVDIEPA